MNPKDCRGMNALAFAVASKRQAPRVVKLLLAKGADVNAASTAKETPLDRARKSDVGDVIATLEKAGAKGSPFPAVPALAAATTPTNTSPSSANSPSRRTVSSISPTAPASAWTWIRKSSPAPI